MLVNFEKIFWKKTTSIIFWTCFLVVWCNIFYFFRRSLINFQSLCIVEGILRFLQDVWFIFAVFVLVLNDNELGQNFPGKDNVITFLKWMKKKRNPNQQQSSTNNNVTTTYYNPSQIVVEEKKIWVKWKMEQKKDFLYCHDHNWML